MDRKKPKQEETIVNNDAKTAAPESKQKKKQAVADEAKQEKKQKASPEIKPEKYEENEETNLVNFKKVVRGFNPAEVHDYIAFLNANLKNARQVFDSQTEELKGDLAFVSRERDKFKEEQKSMAEKVEAYEQMCSDSKAAVNELKELRTQNAQLQEQVKNLFAKLASCKNLLTENQKYKIQIAEIDRERSFAENERAKLNAEIAELRETNTKQAYGFAEQKKEVELQFYEERLRRSELLQVHTYHIQKSEELFNEMVKQFSLAKKSLNEINSKL